MTTFSYPNEFFSPKATLECGQVFRFSKLSDNSYFLLATDKACILSETDGQTLVTCEESDEAFFRQYFDLPTDYAAINDEARAFDVPYLSKAADYSKGLRILRQDKTECLLSFIVSQQNNIPRIKGILSRLSESLGEKRAFFGHEYFAFPSLSAFADRNEDFYRALGLGYRAKYIAETSRKVLTEGFDWLSDKSGKALKKALTSYMGIGNKVADCIALFAFHDTAAFPVDTWIEKLYHEDFGGKETDREKINRFFVEKFGKNAGIFQQYLFYYKRENR